MKLPALALTALAALLAASHAAPVSITVPATTYTQNFNSLGTGSPAWTNDATIPGWYVQINNGVTATGNAQAADGTAVLSGLLNLGTSGATDRALGSKATGTGAFANIAYAVSFQNNTTKPIALSQLQYTGELWRTNTGTGTPLVAVNEEFTLFYQVSAAAVTNIISGTDSATAAPGTGFAALGAGANWLSPVNSPPGTALDGNLAANRTTVTFNPTGLQILPGQFLMLKWTDSNKAGTDGFQGIDDVSATFVELNGVLAPSYSKATRQDPLATPADPTDDTFGFTANVAGAGAGLSAGWTTNSVNPPAGNASAAPYGANVVWTGFPVSGAKTVSFVDSSNAIYAATLTVQVPRIFGTNTLAAPGFITTDGTVLDNWTADETARTLRQNNSTQADHIVNSAPIDLSTLGAVEVSATLDAITGSSSGFEAPDAFGLQLIVDGGTPVSILGAADVDGSGLLRGADTAGGLELPDATLTNTTKTFNFKGVVPASANSLVIRVIGNSNSVNETFLLKNIQIVNAPPTLFASASGPGSLQNQGTPGTADDTFTVPVTITAVNTGASPGWNSNQPPPASGLYSAANPVTFGPFSTSVSPLAITIADQNLPTLTAGFTATAPPHAITLSAASNIVRHENGPGLADDTVSFDVTVTGANGGPSWTATGATPASGPFGPVTFTVPSSPSPAVVTVADVSYPATTQNISVPVPARYVIGQRNFGTGPVDVITDITATPPAEWINNATLRTLDMNTGGTTDKIVTSEVLNLSTVGTVDFSANLRLHETSVGSNLETTDRFKAELIIDGGLGTEQIINLISAYDTGDGAPAVGPTGGPNGPPNGYINGYQGIAVAPASALDDYNANLVRDEFNRNGQPATDMIDNNFPLAHTIPASAATVQLKIYGTGIGGSEFFTVSGVLFALGIPPTQDTDADGNTDVNEIADGTDPNDPTSLFTITGTAPDPGDPTTTLASLPTVAGRFYRGYYSTDLVTWTRDDSHPLLTGNGTTQTWPLVQLPSPAARRYLRVFAAQSAGAFPPTRP